MRTLDSGAGGGSESHDRETKLHEIVVKLDLDNPEDEVNKPGSDDFAVAPHEEDTRGIVVWAKLRPWLKGYAKALPQGTHILSDEEIEESTKVVLNEPVHFLTQMLIKRHLRKQPPVSLAELAEGRFPRNSANWERYQQKLAREIFDHARDLQLWEVEVLGRVEHKNGGGAIAGYKISAGPALIDFDRLVFFPKRVEQHQRFYARYEHHLKKNKEN